MKKFFWLMLGVLLTSGAFAQQEALKVKEFKKEIKKKEAIVLDVRTPEEFADGHIRNATNADWKNPEEFKIKISQLPRTEPVYVYCRSGVRSEKASEWLRANGFTQVSGLDGGIEAWKKAGKRVSKAKQ